MKKFVFVYYGKRVTEEHKQHVDWGKIQEKWSAWFATFKDNMVDGGNQFGSAKLVSATGVETLQDELPATGYTIINAQDMDEATKIAQGCPALEWEGGVRVYETMPM